MDINIAEHRAYVYSSRFKYRNILFMMLCFKVIDYEIYREASKLGGSMGGSKC